MRKLALALAFGALTTMGAAAQTARPAAATGPLALSFNGTSFLHRWSQKGQNEFTPAGEENLDTWKSMVTINVYEQARNGAQLDQIADRTLTLYHTTGRVLRTASKPRTKDHEAEHFVAVVFPDPKVVEAAFARFLVFDKRGVTVIYSHRTYGTHAGDQMALWLTKNGPLVEKSLLAWDGMPALATLRGLPQAVGQ
jgi:hypothetical protein